MLMKDLKEISFANKQSLIQALFIFVYKFL